MKNFQITITFTLALILSAIDTVYAQSTDFPCGKKGHDMLYVDAPFSKGPYGITPAGGISFDGYEVFCDKMKKPNKKGWRKIKETIWSPSNNADFPGLLTGDMNSFLINHRLSWLEAMPIPGTIRGNLFILSYCEKKKFFFFKTKTWTLIKVPEEGDEVTMKLLKDKKLK